MGTAAAAPARIQVRYVPISELKLHPSNARKHPDKQVKDLAAAIKRFGWGPPLIIHKGVVAAGAGRLAAARLIGMSEVPCVERNDWSEAEFRAFCLADNKIAQAAEWDLGILNDELAWIAQHDASALEATTFELAKIAKSLEAKEESMDSAPVELPGAHALKDDMRFESPLPWGIPMLREDMLGELPDGPIEVFLGKKTVQTDGVTYLWLFGGGDAPPRALADRTITCFYSQDANFEQVWDSPAESTAKMINAGVKTSIAPQFSIFIEQAEVVHLWNTYRNRWVSRYWQEAGIKVIPDFMVGNKGSLDYTLSGIPRDLPAMAVETNNLTTVEAKIIVIEGLKEMLDRLRPKKLLVYSGPAADEVIDAVGCRSMTVQVTSRTLALRQYFAKVKQNKGEAR